MRVTASTFPNSLLTQLNRLATRQSRLQQQAATGQRMTFPDDDPVAMRRVIDMQGEASSVDQYIRNIARHKEVANATYASIKSLKTVVDRASEIATLADDLKSPEELQVYATEVNELIKQAAQVVNVQNRGDYLFSGTLLDKKPFVVAQDANGSVTGVSYQGNEELSESEIGHGVSLTSQTLGANDTGSGYRGLVADSRTGADLFNHLIALRDRLAAGDTDAVSASSLSELELDADTIVFHIGTNGAVQTRLETGESIMTKRAQNLEALVSKETDADLAQTLVRLNEVQTAYQAALQSGGSILNRSLLDYLR
jgi:flagellar hook-associated protein 3 FlgL